MVKKILQLDFVLSKWFAGKKKNDKVIPGMVFLFLSKMIYFGGIFVVFFLKLIGINKPIFITGGYIVYGLMIMLIVQPLIEKMANDPFFPREYKCLSQTQVYKKRLIALLIYIVVFFVMMVGIIMIGRIKF